MNLFYSLILSAWLTISINAQNANICRILAVSDVEDPYPETYVFSSETYTLGMPATSNVAAIQGNSVVLSSISSPSTTKKTSVTSSLSVVVQDNSITLSSLPSSSTTENSGVTSSLPEFTSNSTRPTTTSEQTSVGPEYTATADTYTATSTTTVATITTCIPQAYKRQVGGGLFAREPGTTTETPHYTGYISSLSTVNTNFAIFTPTTIVTTSVTYTSNVCPTPSVSCNNQGLQWAYYDTAPENSDAVYSAFDPTVYKTETPNLVGTTSTLGGIDTDSDPILHLYGYSVDIPLQYFALNHHGYVFAQLTGTYAFVLPCPDDIDFVWIGPLARSGWTRANANIVNSVGTDEQLTYSIDLVAGTYYPFRVMFGQAQGSARFALSVVDPSGTTILSSESSPSPFLVQYSCDLTTAPPFTPWGSET